MQLVAYLYGIHSERRFCQDIDCNLAYRWFCRLSPQDDVPDHSSFTSIRDRYGEEIFQAIFCRIVALCKAKGLVNEACRVMTDATLIAANAATLSMVPKEPASPTGQAIASRERRSAGNLGAAESFEPHAP